ncbi:MAG TPA: hypothetical protein VHA35_05060 [Dongiaceae bacterium]|jgi:hypothetical protein|nr:hypothetical protein [Dongiaceae bacterium]
MLSLSSEEGKRLADRLGDAPALPAGGEAPAVPLDGGPARIDDATAAYVAAMRAPFEGLRQAEAQLAGLMVLAAASGQAVAGHPMLEMAAEAVREASDGVRAARVPPRARHHHVHVLRALEEIEIAVAAARRCLVRRDEKAVAAAIAPLRSAHRHLIWATGALPGFEIVALSQACCAQHAALPPQ